MYRDVDDSLYIDCILFIFLRMGMLLLWFFQCKWLNIRYILIYFLVYMICFRWAILSDPGRALLCSYCPPSYVEGCFWLWRDWRHLPKRKHAQPTRRESWKRLESMLPEVVLNQWWAGSWEVNASDYSPSTGIILAVCSTPFSYSQVPITITCW